ncbi:hypothetical protein QL285_032949 [Trifolium repens]|nr:hypothetical protein QL285_032949 [Trifolium repens]
MVSIFETFRAMRRIRKEGRKGILMVWHAVVWILWRARNDRIFSGKIVELEEIMDRIKIVSWKWLLAKKDSAPCLFYEWCVDPFDCLAR